VSRAPRHHWDDGIIRQLGRWGAAALVVVAAHAGGAWAVMNWRNEASAGEPPAAVMIELAPLAASPEAPPEITPGPPMTEAEPDPPPEPEPEPEVPPEPTPQVAEIPDFDVPELPAVPDAAAVLTPPAPPKPVQKKVEKRPEKPRKVERRKKAERKDQRVERSSAPPSSEAPRAERAVAPQNGVWSASPSRARATWMSRLSAHLNRYKRTPPEQGGRQEPRTVRVTFTIDRNGRVLSQRLAASSGTDVLDRESLAMIRRADPVPSPPADLASSTVTVTVPIRFDPPR
jgi:protein TonB